jgi:hypothetical protein
LTPGRECLLLPSFTEAAAQGRTMSSFISTAVLCRVPQLRRWAGNSGREQRSTEKVSFFLADYEDNGESAIASISGECKATSMEVNSLPSPTIFPLLDPLVFNSNDDLVFEDNGTEHILTFAHPINAKFAAPISTTVIALPGAQQPHPIYFSCLAGDNAHLWAAQFTKDPKQLYEFNYPQGGTPITSITGPGPGSCVASPPIIP